MVKIMIAATAISMSRSRRLGPPCNRAVGDAAAAQYDSWRGGSTWRCDGANSPCPRTTPYFPMTGAGLPHVPVTVWLGTGATGHLRSGARVAGAGPARGPCRPMREQRL